MTPDTTASILSPPEATLAPTDKAARIAELKAAYPQGRVVSFKGDPTVIVLRRPTDGEVLTIMDKSRVASIVGRDDNSYNYDNGNAEILRLVEVPDAREMEKLAIQRPRIAHTLFQEVMVMCRMDMTVTSPTDEEKKRGAALGFLLGGKVRLLLSLITRPAYERLDFKRLKSDHRTVLPSWLAEIAKKNLIAPVGAEAEALWDAWPFLSNLLGINLFGECSLEVEAEEGK